MSRRSGLSVRLLVGLLALPILGLPSPLLAEVRRYVIAIGVNAAPPAPPAGTSPVAPGPRLDPLRYADDDAAAVYLFARERGASATLLTVLDASSQRRFPGLAALARPPSLVELRRTVTEHARLFAADRAAGHQPVLLLSYSGHGTNPAGQAPSLTLLDGPLTQERLYDEVIALLPARTLHLLIDACHAEAIVRPRDGEARSVEVTDEDVRVYAARNTLARFPQVGAVIATSVQAQAHEWDVYERGIFTHQVLSALRGGADVNGDGRVEYSELHAFLGAANREVADPRARLNVLVHPPALDRRAPLWDLRPGHAGGSAWLVGGAAQLGHFYVEDELGNRIADLRAEGALPVVMAIPAGAPLFVRSARGEARLDPRPGQRVALGDLRFAPARLGRRGALEGSLRRGLFAVAFGPTYYRGFVDRREELVAVPLLSARQREELLGSSLDSRGRLRPLGWASIGVGGALAVAASVLGGLAVDARHEFDATSRQRPATLAAARYGRYRDAAIGTGVAAALSGAAGLWLLVRLPGPRLEVGATPSSVTLRRRF